MFQVPNGDNHHTPANPRAFHCGCTELLEWPDAPEYAGFGKTPAERVRFLLMKLRADDANGTDFMSKFTHKIEDVFSNLPKPKNWILFATNDIPLITSLDAEVKQIVVDHSLNKSQAKAIYLRFKCMFRQHRHCNRRSFMD